MRFQEEVKVDVLLNQMIPLARAVCFPGNWGVPQGGNRLWGQTGHRYPILKGGRFLHSCQMLFTSKNRVLTVQTLYAGFAPASGTTSELKICEEQCLLRNLD